MLYLVSWAAVLGVAYAVTGEATGELDDWAPGRPTTPSSRAMTSSPIRAPPRRRPRLAGVLALLASWVAWGVLTAWIAVRWHRFVLLEERPRGAVPPWDGALIWAYALRSIKVALVMAAVAVALLLGLALAFLLPQGLAAVFAAALGLLVGGGGDRRCRCASGWDCRRRRSAGGMSTAESWRATAPASEARSSSSAALSALLSFALGLLAALPGLSRGGRDRGRADRRMGAAHGLGRGAHHALRPPRRGPRAGLIPAPGPPAQAAPRRAAAPSSSAAREAS